MALRSTSAHCLLLIAATLGNCGIKNIELNRAAKARAHKLPSSLGSNGDACLHLARAGSSHSIFQGLNRPLENLLKDFSADLLGFCVRGYVIEFNCCCIVNEQRTDAGFNRRRHLGCACFKSGLFLGKTFLLINFL